MSKVRVHITVSADGYAEDIPRLVGRPQQQYTAFIRAHAERTGDLIAATGLTPPAPGA